MNDFDRFRPCERMRKHAFAGRNTQQAWVAQLVARLLAIAEIQVLTPPGANKYDKFNHKPNFYFNKKCLR